MLTLGKPVRRATPDSEAIASSDDDKPWPARAAFGVLPRNDNGVPGLPGGIWTAQRRDSLKLSEAAARNAARGLGAPPSALRSAQTPSPSTSDGTGALPFAIPLQPTPKVHRSLSHSQGQRELPPHVGPTLPGSNSGAPALPLGLLAEENDDHESDSEIGPPLTQTFSHPVGFLQRASTYSIALDHNGLRNGRGGNAAEFGSLANPRVDSRLDSAFAGLGLGETFLAPCEQVKRFLEADQPQRRSQWQSHLGWDDLPNTVESRRHSLAEIPTRRGSLVGEDRPMGLLGHHLPTQQEEPEDHDIERARQAGRRHHKVRADHLTALTARMRRDEGTFNIPESYKVPFVEIRPEERTEDDLRRERSGYNETMFRGAPGARPRKLLYIVSFKCSRVEVFYLLDNTGLEIREGDLVIVEADRGQDLGTVQHANVTPDQARLFKRKYAEEQYKWLMMFSRSNQPGNVNPNAQLYAENSAASNQRVTSNLLANAPATMQGLPRDNYNNLKPKAIKRLASSHEIKMLAEKEGNEAKAKRACQQKVAHLHLQMEILDAEWQWDFQKLIFYYYADHYINFKDLITDLYRIYKTRIWLSAVNPASFSQHALGQPPSGVGPGATMAYGNTAGLNESYTMAYGQDPDPYGARAPYPVPTQSYDPNYPSIPGIANSFAPPTPHQATAFQAQPLSAYGGPPTPDAYGAVQAPHNFVDPQPPNPFSAQQPPAFGAQRAPALVSQPAGIYGGIAGAFSGAQPSGAFGGGLPGNGAFSQPRPRSSTMAPTAQSFTPFQAPNGREVVYPPPIGTRRAPAPLGEPGEHNYATGLSTTKRNSRQYTETWVQQQREENDDV
ncbi:PSP1 C-terminal conserved region [Teratosphaeria destructans]|uniref:PSP1 C-terminal conserved region n=1 Tax=Teratosphaeria destructans TaxID=418781 RepID=A0A9W7SJN5_9PEZI|nr:PSP1 C-terminal conserved region [Teratosphaeria destructans]